MRSIEWRKNYNRALPIALIYHGKYVDSSFEPTDEYVDLGFEPTVYRLLDHRLPLALPWLPIVPFPTDIVKLVVILEYHLRQIVLKRYIEDQITIIFFGIAAYPDLSGVVGLCSNFWPSI